MAGWARISMPTAAGQDDGEHGAQPAVQPAPERPPGRRSDQARDRSGVTALMTETATTA